MDFLRTKDMYDLTHTIAAELLSDTEYPHQALPKIKETILKIGKTLSAEEYNITDDIFIAKSAKIAPTAYICGPCIIGPNTEVRHGAFIRGSAIIGSGCVIGNSTEIKNAIIFDDVQIPHYNYVGDSVLGYKSHMGAGSIASNVRSDKKNITIHAEDRTMDTGMRKIGTMLADFVEVGCNSVLCPGSMIGKNSIVYPLSRVRGTVPPDSIYKGDDRNIVAKK
ncbi:MAG: UDP-N-acetylglucosamine pyrophosphorylase [Eubacteriales bacterium]|nr:UDP-N-acetylglucosamine pyrophosphorylase [Eubacteriales bacterium]